LQLNGVETEQVKFDLLGNSVTGESVGVGLDITCTDSPQGAPAWFTPADMLPADYPAAQDKTTRRQKPSELLVAIPELYPRGQEDNMFSNHLFLERPPAELRLIWGGRRIPGYLATSGDS
jgi:hypothetical protein